MVRFVLLGGSYEGRCYVYVVGGRCMYILDRIFGYVHRVCYVLCTFMLTARTRIHAVSCES